MAESRFMIRILITGGTFDKEYDELTGRLFFQETHLPEMLRRGRCRLDVAVETVMMIDSLELDAAGRAEIVARATKPRTDLKPREPTSQVQRKMKPRKPHSLRLANQSPSTPNLSLRKLNKQTAIVEINAEVAVIVTAIVDAVAMTVATVLLNQRSPTFYAKGKRSSSRSQKNRSLGRALV